MIYRAKREIIFTFWSLNLKAARSKERRRLYMLLIEGDLQLQPHGCSEAPLCS